MISSPCYDKINKIDCKDRCAGCAVNCERWAEWESQKRAVYNEHKKKANAQYVAEGYHRMAVKKSKINRKRKNYG